MDVIPIHNVNPLKKIFELYQKNQLLYVNLLAESQILGNSDFTGLIEKHYVCLDELAKGTNFMLSKNDTEDKVCINVLPNIAFSGNTNLANYMIYVNIINRAINPDIRTKFQPITNSYDAMRKMCSKPVHPLSFNKKFARLYHKNYLAEFIELSKKMDTYEFMECMRRCWLKNANETYSAALYKNGPGGSSKRTWFRKRDTGKLLKINCLSAKNKENNATVAELFPYLNNTNMDIENKYKSNTKNVNFLIFIDYANISINPEIIEATIKNAGYYYLNNNEIKKPFKPFLRNTLIFATLPDLKNPELLSKTIKNIFTIPNTIYLETDLITLKYFSNTAKNRTNIYATLAFDYLLTGNIDFSEESKKFIEDNYDNSVAEFLRDKNKYISSYINITKQDGHNPDDYVLIYRFSKITDDNNKFIDLLRVIKERSGKNCELCKATLVDHWRNCTSCGLPQCSIVYPLIKKQIYYKVPYDYGFNDLQKHNLLRKIEKYLIDPIPVPGIPQSIVPFEGKIEQYKDIIKKIEGKYSTEWSIYCDWISILDENDDIPKNINNVLLDETIIKKLREKKGRTVKECILDICISELNEIKSRPVLDNDLQKTFKSYIETYSKDFNVADKKQEILKIIKDHEAKNVASADIGYNDSDDSINYTTIMKNYRNKILHNTGEYDKNVKLGMLYYYHHLYKDNEFSNIKTYLLDIYLENNVGKIASITNKTVEDNINKIKKIASAFIGILLFYVLISQDNSEWMHKGALLLLFITLWVYCMKGLNLYVKILFVILVGLLIFIATKNEITSTTNGNIALTTLCSISLLYYLFYLHKNRLEGRDAVIILITIFFAYACIDINNLPYLAVILLLFFILLKLFYGKNVIYPFMLIFAVLNLCVITAVSPTSSNTLFNIILTLMFGIIFYIIIIKKTQANVLVPLTKKYVKPFIILILMSFLIIIYFFNNTDDIIKLLYQYSVGMPVITAPFLLLFSSKAREMWDFITMTSKANNNFDNIYEKMRCIEYVSEVFRATWSDQYNINETVDIPMSAPELNVRMNEDKDTDVEFMPLEKVSYDIIISKKDIEDIYKYRFGSPMPVPVPGIENAGILLREKFGHTNISKEGIIMKKIYNAKTRTTFLAHLQELIPPEIIKRELLMS
jgi:hypothetical protein